MARTEWPVREIGVVGNIEKEGGGCARRERIKRVYEMNYKKMGFSFWYMIAGLGAVFVFQSLIENRWSAPTIPYSEFKTAVSAGKVEEVSISRSMILGRMRPGASDPQKKSTFQTLRVDDEALLRDLQKQNVKVTGLAESTFLKDVLPWLFPIFLISLLWRFLSRRFTQGQSGFMTVGQSKAKIYMETDVKVSFADVAGVDEAKEELIEVIEVLKTPEKFRRLGRRIPKGLLLVGPPGDGETHLAKPMAAAASV